MSQAEAFIGTSGWNYKHWREVFYPRGVRQADWLAYYARHFGTVEINYSFYRIPPPQTVAHWIEQAPRGFRFAVKMWRGITHYKKLKNTGEYLGRFLDVVSRLPPRMRAPLLVQLPPNQGKDLDRLERFLTELRAALRRRPWKVAVEFRHDSWTGDAEVERLLTRKRAALCLHDMQGRAAASQPNDVDFVYIRRHGPSGDYQSPYSANQIRQDARRIRAWRKAGRAVYVYYNNDAHGNAIRNARELLEAVG